MVSKLHERLGTAGFIIAIVALVAAMSGGAYAASGGLTGKQKKEVEKIAKKYSGKPGKPGKNGKNGTNGTNGSNGAKGDTGAAGSNGSNGAAGGQGPQGIQGPPGETGFTEFLPSGKTETGVFGIYPNENTAKNYAVPITFQIPLESAPQAVFLKEGETSVAGKCPGEVGGLPQAEPGFLCVYGDAFEAATVDTTAPLTNGFFHGRPAEPPTEPFGGTANGASPAGAMFAFKCEEFCNVAGSWAVTAE